MLAHPSKKKPDPSGKRVMYMDNFYTRHRLGQVLKKMTDGEVRITGTCRTNLVNKVNLVGVKKAIAALESEPRGSWALVRAYDDEENEEFTEPASKKRKRQSGASKKSSKSQKTRDKGSRKKQRDDDEDDDIGDETEEERSVRTCDKEPNNPVPNAGYIIFKDRKTVVFYSNDLASTPPEWFCLGKDREDCIACVHGLAPLPRWTDDSVMNRCVFQVPAVVVAYNLFMNAVDRMDQRRPSNPCMRKERRLSQSIFSAILDFACNNGYAIGCTVSSSYKDKVSFREYKRRVAEQLTKPFRRARLRRASAERPRQENNLHQHILTENIPRSETYNTPRSRDCFLCQILGIEKTGAPKKSTVFGCFECGLHYHLTCFNRRHHTDFNSPSFNAVMSLALQTEKAKKKRASADITNPRDI
jgi:hypothetical protein